jgi:DNA-binding MarR family transcriptional regulator
VPSRLTNDDFHRLLDFRDGLRRFLRWSERKAREAGLTPAQHQLLLAIRGHDDPLGPTIGDVANHLLLRHHSTVELVDRAQAAGLVTRHVDAHDHRVVRLGLLPLGETRLRALAEQHLQELERVEPRFRSLWAGLP